MSDQAESTKTASALEEKLEKADTAVATFEHDDKTFGHIFRGFLRNNPTAIPAGVLIISVLLFGIIAPNFLKATTLSLVLQQVTVTGVIAIAQTAVILTAGIDLSVGAILVMSSLIMGNLAVEPVLPAFFTFTPFASDGSFAFLNVGPNLPVFLAILVGMGAGALMGYFNGALITFLRLPPFIVTLGTLSIFAALKLYYSHSESIRASDIDEKAPFLTWLGQTFNVGGAQMSYGGLAMIALAAFAWYLLNRTPWGRHVHAVGDDPDSALLAGIQVRRVTISVYAFAGLICGFCGWIAIGRVGSVSPLGFDTANLDSITATVIGGTSLFGGRGSIAGSVLGALIVGVFNTGLSLAGVDDYWQIFAVGVLVIVAVSIDQWLRRASQ